jgi:simple sugar transport system ATP-binding protein
MPKSNELIAEVSGVSKTYGAVQALSGVDFSISRGEVRALLGKNGAGKSTLIRILAGVEEPDVGTLRINGKSLQGAGVRSANALGVRTVYQELSLIPEMTVAENLFMGQWPNTFGIMKLSEIFDRCEKTLSEFGLDISPRATISELSIAQQQLVEIARAVSSEPSLLILDEPTSSLGSGEVDLVLSTVKAISERGVAVIYVSHRLAEIRKIADSVTVMRDGQIAANLTIEEATPSEIARTMLGKLSEERASDMAPKPGNKIAMNVSGIRVGNKVRDVSLEIRTGEVLGIAGLLGSGRTELLQALAGLSRVSAGEIKTFGIPTHNKGRKVTRRLGVGYTSEDRKSDGIIAERGIDENLVMAGWKKVSSLGVVRSARLRKTSENLISDLNIRTESPKVLIKNLSGGNQQKVVIGRQLHVGSRILLLDEPTRGVDIEAKAQIYRLLRDLAAKGDAVVFVSSEIEELALVADRVMVLSSGAVVGTFDAPDFNTETLLVAAMAEPES